MNSREIFKKKAAGLHELFQTYLIVMQKRIKKSWMVFSISLLIISILPSLLEYFVYFLSLSVDEVNLGFNFRRIFHLLLFYDYLSYHVSAVYFFFFFHWLFFILFYFCIQHIYLQMHPHSFLFYSLWMYYYLLLIQKGSWHFIWNLFQIFS